MTYKDQFLQLCEDIELELAYRLGADLEELKAIEEYFKIKHDYLYAHSYKHGIKKLEELRKKLMGAVR